MNRSGNVVFGSEGTS